MPRTKVRFIVAVEYALASVPASLTESTARGLENSVRGPSIYDVECTLVDETQVVVEDGDEPDTFGRSGGFDDDGTFVPVQRKGE